MFTRTTLAIAGASVMTLVATIPTAVAAPGGEPGKPTTDAAATLSSYIVQFTPGADRAAEVSKAKAMGMQITYEYDTVFSGMAVLANKGQAQALASNPNVAHLEEDGVVTTQDTQSPATWGLDRIDQETTTLNNSYSYTSSGQGVTAYVIDTGILTTHTEFEGRTRTGYTAINDRRGTTDCNGHGTHVAGTIGGKTYGVAQSVTLVPVRVLDCRGSGTNSGVIAGVNWVAANAKKPAVANMSLGGGVSTALDSAVSALVASGVTVVVAAGNSNVDAINSSPARVSNAITVGATDSKDSRASFSNYGSIVDIFAPGVSITSAWFKSTTATNTISGTSMASPHVAGAAARILSADSTLLPGGVESALITTSLKNLIPNEGTGSPDRLLYLDPAK